MATAEAEKTTMAKAEGGGRGEGLRQYYLQHIHELQLRVGHQSHNLQRLEAHRNDLNSRGSSFLFFFFFLFLFFGFETLYFFRNFFGCFACLFNSLCWCLILLLKFGVVS